MKTYLDPEEVQVLEEAATNLRDRLLIRMFFRLGYRASEAVGLEVEDVDLQEGALTIEHLKVRLNLYCPECGVRLGKSHQFCPGCGSKVEQAVAKEREHRRVRTLPLDRETLEMLQEHLGHQNIGTTMRYRKVAGQELREWYEKLWNGSEENSG